MKGQCRHVEQCTSRTGYSSFISPFIQDNFQSNMLVYTLLQWYVVLRRTAVLGDNTVYMPSC